MEMRMFKQALAGIAVAIAISLPIAAAAQTTPYDNPNPPVVDAGDVAGTDTAPPDVRGVQQPRALPEAAAPQSAALPLTGTDIAGLVTMGAVAVGAGTVLVRRSRRLAIA